MMQISSLVVQVNRKENTLQQDLFSLQEWSSVWQVCFSTEKCNVVHLGKNNPRHKYKRIGNDGVVTLNSTECKKDLGVYVDTELNFQCHVDRSSWSSKTIF